MGYSLTPNGDGSFRVTGGYDDYDTGPTDHTSVKSIGIALGAVVCIFFGTCIVVILFLTTMMQLNQPSAACKTEWNQMTVEQREAYIDQYYQKKGVNVQPRNGEYEASHNYMKECDESKPK